MGRGDSNLYASINSDVSFPNTTTDKEQCTFNLSETRWRTLLVLTGMLPSWKCKQIFCRKISFLFPIIFIVLVLYFVSEAGAFNSLRKWRSNVEMDLSMPFTSAHMIIWELRWIISYALGTFFCCREHLTEFTERVYFPNAKKKHYKRLWWFHSFLVTGSLVAAPAALHWYELKRWGHEGMTIPALDTFFFVVYRLITLPSFCMITFILYLLGSNVQSLGELLIGMKNPNPNPNPNHSKDLNQAKSEILKVRTTIKRTESNLQLYLIFHMILIILAAVMGVFSCIERFRIAGQSYQTEAVKSVLYWTALEASRHGNRSANYDFFKSIFSQNNDNTLAESLIPMIGILTSLLKATNTSRPVAFIGPGKPYEQYMYASKESILWLYMVNLLEVLVLYLIPLCLIFRQNKCIEDIKEDIEAIDCADEDIKDTLLSNESSKDSILKLLSLLKPVRLYGYHLNVIKTVALVCITQILSVLIKMAITPEKS